MELDFYQLITIILLVSTPITIAILKYAHTIRKCIDKADMRTFRISKALIVLANRLDDIIQEQHGKTNNLGPEIEVILQDDHGNL